MTGLHPDADDQLAANDWQERTDARRGGIEDRNVELLVPMPFDIGGSARARPRGLAAVIRGQRRDGRVLTGSRRSRIG